MEKTTKQQTQEIFVLKNDMRYTRVNELERENKTYLQEILQLQRMVDNELNLIEGSDSFKKLRVNLMEAEQNLRNANANVHTLEGRDYSQIYGNVILYCF